MGIYLLNQPVALSPVLLRFCGMEQRFVLSVNAVESENGNKCDSLVRTSRLVMSESNKLTGHEIIVVDEALNGMVDMNKIQVTKDEDTSLVNVEILGDDPPNNFQRVLEMMGECDDFYRELLEDPDFQEITNMSKEEVNLLIRADGENPDAIVAHIRDFACQIDSGNVADFNDFKRKQYIESIKDNTSLNEAVSEIISNLEEKQDQYLEELKEFGDVSTGGDRQSMKPVCFVRPNIFRSKKAWSQSYIEGMFKVSISDEVISLLELLKLQKPSLLPLAVSFLRSELEHQKKGGASINSERLINVVKKKLSSITKVSVLSI